MSRSDPVGSNVDRIILKVATTASADRKHPDKPKTDRTFSVILTAEHARTIYLLRSATTAEDTVANSVAGKSSLVAEMFGVSPKTIRDVWNRRSWVQVTLIISTDVNTFFNRHAFSRRQVTRDLWSEQEACLYEREHMTPVLHAWTEETGPLVFKRRGRPPGAKDARPRKRRHSSLPSPPGYFPPRSARPPL